MRSAQAEGKLTLQLLKYARFARGGRVNPQSLSRILDMTPPIKDPNAVLTELASASSPDTYLQGTASAARGLQDTFAKRCLLRADRRSLSSISIRR